MCPPEAPGSAGGRADLEDAALARVLVDDVTAMAQRASTTPFAVLLSAFAAVLARSSGARDLCIGAPVAYRNHPELAGLVAAGLRSAGYLIDLAATAEEALAGGFLFFFLLQMLFFLYPKHVLLP